MQRKKTFKRILLLALVLTLVFPTMVALADDGGEIREPGVPPGSTFIPFDPGIIGGGSGSDPTPTPTPEPTPTPTPQEPENSPESPAEMPEYPDVYIVDADNDIAYIYGTVDPAILSAEVTLSTFFHIDPNAPEGERFTSPEMTIRNTATMPISVSAVSFKATGEAPRVVPPTRFTDTEWSELGLADTKTNIALGFTGAKTGDFFFDAEDEQDARTLGVLESEETMSMGLQSKFGLTWDKPYVFKYESVFSLALID